MLWLYLALAVLPDGRRITVGDAAVLLFEQRSDEGDEKTVQQVMDILERWSILTAAGGTCSMHEAHASFARKNLVDRGDVRRPAVERWVDHISWTPSGQQSYAS